MKFKIKSYNQERLYLQNNIDEPLECNKKNEELICPIKKNSLECYSSLFMMSNQKIVSLLFFSKSGNLEQLFFVSSISFNFKVQKMDVNIEITKLFTDYVEKSNYIAYETNLINFPSLMALLFNLTFIGKEEKEKDLSCMLRKGQNSTLIILCASSYNHKDEISLKEIKNDYAINDINIKYNFIIKPVNNNQKINIINSDYSYPIIASIYPNILDFTSNDSFDIDLYLDEPKNVTGITFNEEVEDLKCENLIKIKRCKISKEHFKGKNDGYYYIKYLNHNINKKSTSFVTNPVTIILPKSNIKLILIIAIVSSVAVIIIIANVIFVCIYKRKNSDLKDEVLKTSFKEEGTDEEALQ